MASLSRNGSLHYGTGSKPGLAPSSFRPRARLHDACRDLRAMLAGDVQELLALLRRKSTPDVPRRERDPDRAEPSCHAQTSHGPILAQHPRAAASYRSGSVVLAIPVVFVFLVPVTFLVRGFTLRLGRRRRGLVGARG
jgi:hypothetical protein